MSYQVTKIHDHYREIIRLDTLGMTRGQIAKRLGKTVAMVAYVLDSPLIRHQVDILQAQRDDSASDIGQQIDAIAPKALAYIDTVIDGIVRDPITGDPLINPQTGKPITHQAELRYKAAKDIMSMSGHGPVQRVRKHVAHGLFSLEDIERFKQRAREVGVVRTDAERVQDVETVDVHDVHR